MTANPDSHGRTDSMTMTEDDDHRTKTGKQHYDDLLETVEMNTAGGGGSPDQPAGMRLGSLVANRMRAGKTLDGCEHRVTLATERGDLLRWTDADGRDRVARPGPVAARAIVRARDEPVTPAGVTAVIEAEVASDDPDKRVIGELNQLAAELREADRYERQHDELMEVYVRDD